MSGEQFNTEQAMAVGPNAKAKAKSVTFNRFSADGGVDPARLKEELASLRSAVRDDPSVAQDDKDDAVGALREAEKAAERGDSDGTGRALAKLGTWVLGIGQGIGAGLAVAAIRQSLGM
jgi:hypothetical protein